MYLNKVKSTGLVKGGFCFFILLFINFNTLNGQERIYINSANTNTLQNGLNWSTAYADLQIAISDAQFGDTLWVAKGTYKPTDTDDRTVSFVLTDGLVMLGGFAGTETAAEQRDPALHPTILSGAIGDPDDPADNSYHVMRGKGLSSATLLDGLVIRDGFSYDQFTDLLQDTNGAGLLLEAQPGVIISRPRIHNCRFINNKATLGGGICTSWKDPDNPILGIGKVIPEISDCVFIGNRAFGSGGAIYQASMLNTDTFMMSNCLFIENYAFEGGGGAVFLNPVKGDAVYTFKNCDFERDSSQTDGGAINFVPNSDSALLSLNLINCTVKGCIGGEGGAIANTSDFAHNQLIDVHFWNCRFEENKATAGLGAVCLIVGAHKGMLKIDLKSCLFRNNGKSGNVTSFNSIYGANIEVDVNDCEFIDNIPGTSISAVHVGLNIGTSNGLNAAGITNVRVNNCLFKRNGGAIAIATGNTTQAVTEVRNCTFLNNQNYVFTNTWSPDFQTYGAFNKFYVRNCIIWEPQQELGLLFYGNNPFQFQMYGFSIDHCLLKKSYPLTVPGSQDAFGAGNIFGSYPMFKDTLAGDYSLLSCAPAMDAGDNNAAPLSAFDLAGNPRIRFGTIDLGAYEQQDSCGMSAAPIAPDLASKTLLIWPNPSGSESVLHFQVPVSGEVEIRVLDITGNQQVVKRILLSEDNSIDLSALDAGVYWVELVCGRELYVAKWANIK